MYRNSYMTNSLLTSYLNITKLLELTPNTSEYNHHRTTMSKEEIEVVRQIKKKQAMDKHRMLKKQHVSKTRNSSEISQIPENEKATNSNDDFETSGSELTDNSEIHPNEDGHIDEAKHFSTSFKNNGAICDEEVLDSNEISNDAKSETASHDEQENEIMSRQLIDNSEITPTSHTETDTETELQVFHMYDSDEEDESDNSVYDELCEEADELLEEYHQKMDKTTFKQFNKLYDKLLRLVKNKNYDEDELFMLQSQLRNMMDEDCIDEQMDEVLDKFIEETVCEIELCKHKDRILKQIENLKAITKTSEEIEAMDRWMPLFEDISRLKQIRLKPNSKTKKKKHKKRKH